MSGRGSTRIAARLLCAAAVSAFAITPAFAQNPAAQPPLVPDAAELDPSAPLDPMPDLDVAWPDLNARDSTEPAPAADQNAATDEGSSEVRYTLVVEGLTPIGDAGDLLAEFRKQSALEADRKDPANSAQIGRRSRADADLLAELLRSQGYYDAVVEPRTERAGGLLRVVLTAEPGTQYHFASVKLPGLEAAGPEDQAKLRAAFGVGAGDPVIAQDVISGGAALMVALGEQGFAEAKIGEQDIEINHQTHLATLSLPVDPGPVARFGQIRVSGKPPFSARHIATIARFKSGSPFRRSKIEDLRRALIATGLVSVAEIRVVPVNGGRTVDLAVRLEPAPQHTIAGELGYGTGQGARLEASWTDRNFFNPEGALTLRAIGGTREQLAGVQFRRSNFLRRDQVLNLQASASHQNFDAYEARTILLAGNIERQSNFIWQKKWTWTAGGELLATDERGVFSSAGLKDTRTFLIAAVPASLGYDGSDSLLDPTRGFRLSGRISPEISAHGGKFAYGRVQLDASAYHPVSDRVVAAGRVRVGTILGASAFDIAPSRRFYSGGGGSVRGYGYQRLGPKDVDGDPVGGRGLMEFAVEARIRLKQFGGNFGLVPFFDGGSLTTKALPDVKDWHFAAGVGARYYSSFGPIRIDVGVPLNREKGDGPLAVTVSLGQAF
ncbi:autotransporter assembly complex protein TamA [Sphingomonas sp. URHD0057]|uniref:autotransporter assembly complex protein TamA n=1 Tax=Sphingomonas sp. URHD0057 TaxID=1380389 RepID=UPI00048BE380|nr:BamA/TamA family outer membrane protein [Sphingomonas sp. URHD0057]